MHWPRAAPTRKRLLIHLGYLVHGNAKTIPLMTHYLGWMFLCRLLCVHTRFRSHGVCTRKWLQISQQALLPHSSKVTEESVTALTHFPLRKCMYGISASFGAQHLSYKNVDAHHNLAHPGTWHLQKLCPPDMFGRPPTRMLNNDQLLVCLAHFNKYNETTWHLLSNFPLRWRDSNASASILLVRYQEVKAVPMF